MMRSVDLHQDICEIKVSLRSAGSIDTRHDTINIAFPRFSRSFWDYYYYYFRFLDDVSGKSFSLANTARFKNFFISRLFLIQIFYELI